jgi:hypothetical protein
MDANEQGEKKGKKVYIHAVGLGLGEWLAVKPPHVNGGPDYDYSSVPIQLQCFLEVFRDILQERKYENIGVINFSWFPALNESDIKKHGLDDFHIDMIVSNRNRFDLLEEKYQDFLLYATYAWDSFAFPGNEYFYGMLSGTDDPDAAKSSTITEIQNPLINPCMIDNTKKYISERLNALELLSQKRTPLHSVPLSITDKEVATKKEETNHGGTEPSIVVKVPKKDSVKFDKSAGTQASSSFLSNLLTNKIFLGTGGLTLFGFCFWLWYTR